MSADERRLTPTERLHEVTMAALNRSAAPPEHSIDVTRNAKGDYQFSVTVRGHDADEVAAKAIELTSKLAVQYPRENGGA